MDLYAETVAKKLGIEHWYANTTLHWDEQDNLYDMDYELDQASIKLQQFGQFCLEKGLEPEDCLIIGDGENDAQLFEACKHGVLIDRNSDGKPHAWKRVVRLADFEPILQDH